MTSPAAREWALGGLEAAFGKALDEASKVAPRIWGHDASLWTQDGEVAAKIGQRLGWLDSVATMLPTASELTRFASDLANDGYERVLLLGMGGSSLCPEVLRRSFGVAVGMLDVRVLDSTHPDAVRAAHAWADEEKTLFLVASKSGTTTEVVSFYRYFRSLREDGDDFLAITDPGTTLEQLARTAGFRRAFLNHPHIGGRYSALSYFGLLPAALLGIDLTRLLQSAERLTTACGPESAVAANPGVRLGVALAVAARAGRDKLTLRFSRRLRSFGSWIEQLVAESTGKEGKGILPVDGEPLRPAAELGADRLFVFTVLGDEERESLEQQAQDLIAAGHPVIVLAIDEPTDLGGEFFRWEMATAVAGALLGINPFDEPNVSESKDLTRELLEEHRARGTLPTPEVWVEAPIGAACADEALRPLVKGDCLDALLRAHLGRAQPPDYVALLAYVPCAAEVEHRLQAIRARLLQRVRCATTLGFGPRFLHSTGQLHKGGPGTGVFLQLVATAADLPIEGEEYGFATLVEAQALGDLRALERRGRRFLRLHLKGDLLKGLEALDHALAEALA